MSEITLSIVTYNQSELLKKFVEVYLDCQDSSPSKTSLLIINDGSTDQTKEYIHQLSLKHPLIIIYNGEHHGISHARNTALKLCPTRWVAFTDTDCILDKDYFNTLRLIPSLYPNKTAIEGRVLPEKFNPSNSFTHKMSNTQGGMFTTANMIFNVAKTLELGAFDEEFINYREDIDLGLKINSKDPIPFFSQLKITHPNLPRHLATEIFKTVQRTKNIILSEHLLYHKHPQMYQTVRFQKNATRTLDAFCKKNSFTQIRQFLFLYRKHYRSNPDNQQLKHFPHIIFSGFRVTFLALWEQLIFNYFTFKLKRKMRVNHSES